MEEKLHWDMVPDALRRIIDDEEKSKPLSSSFALLGG
jgi:hypothetical protein